VNNFSDHIALICGLSTSVFEKERYEKMYSKKPAWHKAKAHQITQFRETLDDLLQKIDFDSCAANCINYQCSEHKNDLDCFIDEIISACITAEDICIPKTASKHQNCMPGWNDEAKGLHEEALHWHRMWKNAGSPAVGELAEQRKISRRNYHQAVRRIRRHKHQITMNKIAANITENRTRDLWQEVSRLKKTATNCPINCGWCLKLTGDCGSF
jgi:hypothetical protein